MSKKSHLVTNKYSENTFTNLFKYINWSKRAGLVTMYGPCGLTSYGSKKMMEVYNKYESEFLEASLLDNKGLNDEDPFVVQDHAPISIEKGRNEKGIFGKHL